MSKEHPLTNAVVLSISSGINFYPITYVIKMNSWLKNTITSLYNALTTPVAETRDALAKRLQSVRETASLLYRRTKLGYGERKCSRRRAS